MQSLRENAFFYIDGEQRAYWKVLSANSLPFKSLAIQRLRSRSVFAGSGSPIGIQLC
jgi:hypothetical protein